MVQGTINGYGERCGNANLVSILPALQLKLGYECVPADRLRLLTETAHFVDELTNTTPDPDQPYVGRNAFAHKGGMHVAGVQADARTFEHIDPKLVGNSRDVLISELSGKGSVLSRAESAGIDLDADAAKRAVERIKEREHRGYHYEAADASFELLLRREAGEYQSLFRLESFRVITEKRADGQVETEATIKIWVEGRRYVRTAEGNGPVNALDRALRDAIGELHPHLADIELIDYKVRILDSHHGTGAVTRVLLDSSDGHDVLGLDRRLGEHHRGLLGGAGRLARVRVPATNAPASRRTASGRVDADDRRSRSPGPSSASARRSWCSRCCARGGSRSARCRSASSATSPSRSASPTRSRSPPGTAALHLGVRALGWGEGDEVVTSPFSFVASANCLLYEGVTPVFCDVDPVTLNLDPAAAWDGDRRAHRRPAAGRHPRLPGGDAGARAGRRRGRPRAARGRLRGARRARRRGPAGRLARQPRGLRLLRQQAADDGGGGDARRRRPGDRGAAAQRAQPGPRAGHGLGRPRPARLQLPAHRGPGGARGRPARAPRRAARRPRAAWPRSTPSASPRSTTARRPGEGDPAGLVLPCADRGDERRSWFVYAVRLPAGADRDAVVADLAQRGVEAKAYMPVHPPDGHYRERFGFREGQFPVAEDASARLLALPFFPAITEAQIDRVCEALAEALRGDWT